MARSLLQKGKAQISTVSNQQWSRVSGTHLQYPAPPNMNIPKTAYIGKSVSKRHIKKAISSLLQPGESLVGAFHGQVMSDGGYGLSGRYKGGMSFHDYLLVTDARVILWARGLIAGSTDSFEYRDISSVEESRGLLLGEIVINVRGTKERVRSMVRSDVPVAANLLRERVANSRQPTPAATSGIPEQIQQLSDLMRAGVLSEEEFNTKKLELLDRL